MTNFLDNQIDLFDLETTVPEPADCMEKEQLTDNSSKLINQK